MASTSAEPGPSSPAAPAYPAGVPVLVDGTTAVVLRAITEAHLPGVVEQCQDPEMIRWTTVPTPEDGYGLAQAEQFLASVVDGWRDGTRLSWAIEEAARPGVFCGTISLRREDGGLAEVGFGLHPAARGRRLMTAALRLVRDHAFDVVGLTALRWEAGVGNWASRRVAAAAGFTVEGTVRGLVLQRGERVDGWIGTITAEDPRQPVPWLDPPVLTSARLRLRPFTDADAPRIAEACADARTQHWLASLPRAYGLPQARVYLEAVREASARGTGMTWCVADPADDRCLGSLSLEGFGGYDRRAEIGYWSHPEARGRGVTTGAVRLVTAHAEDTQLVDSLLIRVAATNVSSRRVAEVAGYRQVGVLTRAEPLADGTVDDLVLYARP